MTARILSIEIRRSFALFAGLIIAAIGVFLLFASNPPYRAWMELAITQRDIMLLTWPLALGAGAWQGIRERRSRVEELLTSTPRPRWRRILPLAAAMAIGGVAAYLVTIAGAAAHLRHPAGYFSPGAVPVIALGALAMVGAVWLGLAIGALVPSSLTAPMLVVVGFVGLAVVPPMLRNQDRGDPGAILLLPHLQGPRDGLPELQMLSSRVSLTQALWLVGLAATALALFAAVGPRTRVLALGPVVLGAVVAVPLLPRQANTAWVEDRRAAEVICTSDEARVCVARAYSYLIDTLREPARQALSALAAKLPPAPTRVLVTDLDKAAIPRPADSLLVDLYPLDDGTTSPDSLVWTMVSGAGFPPCPAVDEQEKDKGLGLRYVAARQTAAAWLLDRDPGSPPNGRDGEVVALARQALAILRALPADEQRARMAAVREAERTCADGDHLELLTDTAR